MPIVEIAHCQYITVHIIFLLNPQTITITLDVIKLRGRGLENEKSSKAVSLKNHIYKMFLKLFHCQETTNTSLWETLVHTFRETGASVEILYTAIEL